MLTYRVRHATKACRSLGRTAAIALELSVSSIRCVEDLWTREKIRLVFDPAPVVTDPSMLGEIVIRSFGEYLNRPGHVLLPDGFIADEEMEKERERPLEGENAVGVLAWNPTTRHTEHQGCKHILKQLPHFKRKLTVPSLPRSMSISE